MVSDSDLYVQDYTDFSNHRNLRMRNPIVLRVGSNNVHPHFKNVRTCHTFWGLYASCSNDLQLLFDDGSKHLISSNTVSLLPPWKAFCHQPLQNGGQHTYVLFALPHFPMAMVQSIAPDMLYLENSDLLSYMLSFESDLQKNKLSQFMCTLRAQEIVSKAIMIFSDSLTSEQQLILHNPSSSLPRIRPAIDYIHNNLEHSIAISDLAGILNVSNDHCSRLFKKHLGHSPIEYILSLRISRVCELLLNSHLSLEDIAHACGFPNRRYLSRRFSAELGMPPGQFRTLHHHAPQADA